MAKKVNLNKLARNFTTQVRALEPAAEGESQLYEISVSSETPVERFMFGEYAKEVLSHEPAAVDLSRADGMPLLLEHDYARQIGVVESIAVQDGRLVATVRFSKSAEGAEVERDVADRIRRNISVGYVVREYNYTGMDKEGSGTYVATNWMPIEVSIVSVPADHTIGIGRSSEDTFTVTIRGMEEEDGEPKAADGTDADAATESTEPAHAEGTEAPAAETPAEDAGEPAAADQEEKPADAQRATDEAPAADDASTEATAAETTDEAARSTDEADKEQADAASGTPEKRGMSHEQATASVRSNDVTAEIVRLAEARGFAHKAADFIQRGLTVEQATQELFALTRSKPLNSHEQALMNKNEKQTYSYARAIQVALGELSGGLEADISAEIARQLPKGYEARGGIFVPVSMDAVRSLNTQTGAAGGETVFTEQGELIDLLRNRSVTMQMGARMLPGLQGPVSFPKIVSGAEAHWVSENPGSDVDESQLAFGSVTLSPKTLQATTAFSRQLLAQSALAIESIVKDDITKAHALAIDRAVLHGAGGNEPVGIYNAAGVNIVDMADGVDYGKLVDMIGEVAHDNALMGSLGFVMTPRMAAKLSKTLEAQAAGSGFIWKGRMDEGQVAGYNAMASGQVASNLGVAQDEQGIIFGNFDDVLIGTWGVMELVVDPYRLKKQGLIEVTSFQLADVALRNGVSFTKATGAKL